MADLRLPAGQRWHRPWLAVGLAGGTTTLLVVGVTGLPSATAELPAIARHAMQIALPQWGTTEVVSEIVYGSRGWDTFGETFLLLAAVSAVALLSRGREPRDEYVGEASAGVSEQAAADPHESADREEAQARKAEEEEEEDEAAEGADDDPLGEPAPERAVSMTVVVRVASRAAALLLTVVAFYIVLWGYTPGGGFPAGAALAGVAILLYAALGHRAVRAVVRPAVLEPIELAGAALIVAVGLVGLAHEGSFLDNWLPPARLKERYEKEIRPELVKQFEYTTPMQAPRITKITLNMGVGEAKQDSNMLDAATEQLATIAGQKPNVRRAKKSIASFKLREGMPVGVAVTLRGERGYEFLDRLMSIAIPRIRDFRGLSPRSFDGRGNYTIGIREQIIFPEIDYDSIDQVRGLDVTITTTAQSDEEAFALLEAFGMPFSKEGRPGGPATDEEDAEEERRKEEARQRAEAEQAALEQLKEENPEAYAKPEPKIEEGEEGEGGEAAPEGGEETSSDGDQE